MRHAAMPAVLAVLLLNTALALRGMWDEKTDLLSQHPFSDPVTRCEVYAFAEHNGTVYDLPLPDRLYRTVPGRSYQLRSYQELTPRFEELLTQYLQRFHPGAQVDIDCRDLHPVAL